MEVVYYLVTDSPRNGYCLIDEVEGDMIVEPAKSVFGFLNRDSLNQTQKLRIKAVDNGEEHYCELYLLKSESSNECEKSNVFFTKITSCDEYVYFEVVPNKIKYNGEKLGKDLKLNLLKPKNSYQLERLCKEKNFFFIGEKTVK